MSRFFSTLALMCLIAFQIPESQAETVTIQARYRPGHADFIDINPPGRMCIRYAWHCLDYWKAFAVDLPIEYRKVTLGMAPDPRDQFYTEVPQQVRISLIHDRTGERQEAVLSFVALSQRVFAPLDRNPAHAPNAGPCSLMGIRRDPNFIEVDWTMQGKCFTSGLVDRGTTGESTVDDVQAIIRIDAPSPHRMKHGMWRGSVTFNVGNGGHIDFGNQVTMTRGSAVQVDLELEVEHAFVVDFAPGSELAILEPPGGWPSFWNRHAHPPRLYREHPFRLWSSGPFKLYMSCEFPLGDACAIQDRTSPTQIPIEVAVSLPGNLQNLGAPVRKLILPVGPAQALDIESLGTGFDQRAALHYEVKGEQARRMEPGHTYQGWITLIFDAEL
jgi:hypothetical protein